MNILVTGGAGYIGSITCKELVRRGHEVTVYDSLLNSKPEYAKWGELVVGDVVDSAKLAEVLKSRQIEGVFHFAGVIEVGESKINPMKFFKNNVVGTYGLLEAIKANAASVKTLVFSSTCATYGDVEKMPMNEGLPQKPVSVYAETKLMCEQMIRALGATQDLSAVMLRYFNAAGADVDGEAGENHDPETHLVPLVIRAAMDPAFELSVFGTDYPTPDGTCLRDYTHVTDLAVAHANAIEWAAGARPKFEAFNLGAGVSTSVLEVIRAVEKHTSRKVKYVLKERRPGDPPALVADFSKARRVLEWTPKYSTIDQVVAHAANWYQSQGSSKK